MTAIRHIVLTLLLCYAATRDALTRLRRRVRLWLSVPSLSRGAKARILREVLARRENYFQDDWRDE